MPLGDLLAPERIVMLSNTQHRDEVLHAAARLLAVDPTQTQPIAEGLRKREALASTGIGRGVAIPHVRRAGCEQASAAFLRLSRPVDFYAGDGQAVDLVFAMDVPEHDGALHLQRLAQLAETFAVAGFRQALRDAPDLAALRLRLLPSHSE